MKTQKEHRRVRARRESGQSLLEVALITPLLLALLIGAIEFGRYAYIGILVGNAARAGAAYGSAGLRQSADGPGITAAAQSDFSDTKILSDLGVTSWTSCGCDKAGTITYQGQTSSACTTAGNPSLDTSCSGGTGGHYVVMVSVTASGTFDPLFNFPAVSKKFIISRTATLRVAND